MIYFDELEADAMAAIARYRQSFEAPLVAVSANTVLALVTELRRMQQLLAISPHGHRFEDDGQTRTCNARCGGYRSAHADFRR